MDYTSLLAQARQNLANVEGMANRFPNGQVAPLPTAPTAPALESRIEELEKTIKSMSETRQNNVPTMWLMAASKVVESSLEMPQVKWLSTHIAEGAPGFTQFMQSESIKPLIQMWFETYTSFLEGKAK